MTHDKKSSLTPHFFLPPLTDSAKFHPLAKKIRRFELTPPSNVRKSRLKEGGRPRPPANASRNHRAASAFPFSSHCPPPPAPPLFLSAFQHLPSALPVFRCADDPKSAIAHPAFSFPPSSLRPRRTRLPFLIPLAHAAGLSRSVQRLPFTPCPLSAHSQGATKRSSQTT